MKYVQVSTAVLVAVTLSGCGTTSTTPSYMTSPSYQQRAAVDTTLFRGDEAVLGGETIEAILNARVEIPSDCRLAVLGLNDRGAAGLWSEETTKAQENFAASLVTDLRQCKRVADVSFLPSILTPEKKGIPQLREAAARFQAHLLLVYHSRFESYAKYRLLAKDKARSYCKVEAALLDVRTGIVPFTSISLQQYEVGERPEDMNVYEASMRAQMIAETQGLREIARDLIGFLDAMPSTISR